MKSLLPAALFLLSLLSPVAQADLIQVDWTGTVTSSPIEGIVNSGATIFGSYIYDSASPELSISTSSVNYATNHWSSVSVNGLVANGSAGNINVINNQVECPTFGCVSVDGLIVESTSFTGDQFGGFAAERLILNVGDIGGPLDSTDLPTTDPDFNYSFAINTTGSLTLADGGGSIRFKIESDEYSRVSAVPLPGAAGLYGLGIGLTMFLARRRRSPHAPG